MKKFASSSKGLFSTLCLSLALAGMAHAQVFDFTDFDTQGNTWSAELERGAPANRVEVLDDVTIERFELYTNSRVDHQLRFFIYDINNDTWIYKSNPLEMKGSNYFHWRSSESFSPITLKAGGAYYMGAIPSQGPTITPYQNMAWPYTGKSKMPEFAQGSFKLVAANAVVKNHLDPYIDATASAIFPLRLYEPLAVTTALPDAAQNEDYGPVTLRTNADKSWLAKTWTLLSGPAGLTLTPEGVLSGTPTQSGPLSVEVEVSFAQESGVVATTQESLPLNVIPTPPVNPTPPPLAGTGAQPVPLLGKTGLGMLTGLTLFAGLFRVRRRTR